MNYKIKTINNIDNIENEIGDLFKLQHEHHIKVSKAYDDLYSDNWNIEDLINDFSNKNHWCIYCAEYKNKNIGFITISDSDQEDLGWIAELYVLPEYRGNGVAKKLIEKAHNFRPYKNIILEVMNGNDEVKELYNKCGYKEAATQMYIKLN